MKLGYVADKQKPSRGAETFESVPRKLVLETCIPGKTVLSGHSQNFYSIFILVYILLQPYFLLLYDGYQIKFSVDAMVSGC